MEIIVEGPVEQKYEEQHIRNEEPGENSRSPGSPALPRRSNRANKRNPPQRLIEHMNKVTTEQVKPTTYNEAISSTEKEQWSKAMNEEINALKNSGTWTLTELPEEKTAIGCKWVYKIKTDENGDLSKCEARLVAQGYSQKYGQDYDEVFGPVAKPVTLRLLLTIAGKIGLIVKHYDTSCLSTW